MVSESCFELVRGESDVCFLCYGTLNCGLVDDVLG